jgi:protein-tyrosine phosphatase
MVIFVERFKRLRMLENENSNNRITVSAVTRTRDAGEIALKHCVMPPTVPDRENLLKFDWDKVEEKGQYLFRLLKPRLSERNGVICCYR